jgi:hypothetical protein
VRSHCLSAIAGFFSPQILASAPLLALQSERLSNPDFHAMPGNLGFKSPPDQSTMGAITFSDVVVSHIPFTMDCCSTSWFTSSSIGNLLLAVLF